MDDNFASLTNADFQSVFESAPDPYLVLNPQFVIVAVSRAYTSATMTQRADIVGRSIFEVFPDNPDDPSADGVSNLLASLQRVARTLRPDAMPLQKYDIPNPQAEGGGFAQRYWRPLNTPVTGPDGGLRFIIHRVEDVTEFVRLQREGISPRQLDTALREQAERMETEVVTRSLEVAANSAQLRQANEDLARLNAEANVKLRQLEASFRATFEQAAVGIAHVAPDGHWLRVNQKLCDIVGYPREALLKLTYQDLTWPEDLEPDNPLASEVLAGTRQTFTVEKRYIHKAGHLLWISATVSLVRDDAGQPAYFIAVVQDIQQRKEAELALEEEREVFRNLTDIASDYFWELDAQFRFKAVSPAIVRSGLDMAGYIGKRRWELPSFGISDETWQAHRATLEAHQPFRNLELGVLNIDGEARWFLVSGDPVFSRNGEFRGYRGTTRDITERKLNMERLRQQAMVFNCTEEGVVITDPCGGLIEANPAFERISEYSLSEMRGHNMRFIQSGLQDAAFYQEMWKSIGETGNWQGEIWNRRQSGDTYLVWLSISAVHDDTGKVSNYVGIFIDINRMKHPKSELERLAHHDPLTNLPNRGHLLERLEHALKSAKRRGVKGAVLFIDLDRFKPVNDTLGHQAGDELLTAVAARLTARLRNADTLARIGGDEFVIVLEDIPGADGVTAVADEVIRQLETPFVLAGGHEARIGGSIGIALFPDDGETPARLLERADQALYEAKAAGRGVHRRCRTPPGG